MESRTDMIAQLQRYYALWRESNSMYENWAKNHGLSLNSVMVLYSFYEDGRTCTQKMISQKWVIPKQTVNSILKEFEKRGFIELVPIPADKRNKYIRLTLEGKEYVNTIIEELRDLELYVMEQIGMDSMTSLNDNLALFVELFYRGGKRENE